MTIESTTPATPEVRPGDAALTFAKPDNAPAPPAAGTPPATTPADAGTAGTTPAAGAPAPDKDALTLATEAAATPPATTPPVTEGREVEFEPTGNTNLDYALGFVGKLGFDHEHPAMLAAMDGNWALMEAELAQLGDKAKGYEAVMRLAQAGAKDLIDKRAAKVAEMQTRFGKFAEAAGTQWGEVWAFAGQQATPEQRTEINRAMEMGGLVADYVARGLISEFAKNPGTSLPAKHQPVPTGTTAAAPLAPVTNLELAEARHQLVNKYGNAYEQSPEWRQLAARYAAGQRRR